MCVCCGKREGGGGQGAGNCKLFDGCVEGKWLVVWGHRGRGAVRQSKRITAKHSSAGRLSHSLSTLLCCFPYHSFYTSFFFPSSPIISLFLVVAVVVVLFVSLEVQMLSSFAFVVVAVSTLSLSQSLLYLSLCRCLYVSCFLSLLLS